MHALLALALQRSQNRSTPASGNLHVPPCRGRYPDVAHQQALADSVLIQDRPDAIFKFRFQRKALTSDLLVLPFWPSGAFVTVYCLDRTVDVVLGRPA